jgi:hypothetical protein
MSTPEQTAARLEALAFFGDLLTASSPTTKVKNASRPKPSASPRPTAELVRLPTWKSEALVTHFYIQTCRTCGTRHTYRGTSQVRFSALRRKDSLSVTIPTSLPSTEGNILPHEHLRTYSEVDTCFTCLELDTQLEKFLTSPKVESPKQLELFTI